MKAKAKIKTGKQKAPKKELVTPAKKMKAVAPVVIPRPAMSPELPEMPVKVEELKDLYDKMQGVYVINEDEQAKVFRAFCQIDEGKYHIAPDKWELLVKMAMLVSSSAEYTKLYGKFRIKYFKDLQK